ncbi:cytidylate kinase [Spiroplasma sp. TIUS-1]|uniref:(d)CMP kinase n=1 Tax=Spiroplasma sp. TIUS-1 TaxID=216963 RepID=UPI0013994A67|nr:(d)CMP kinase [Spiroplasma sp. TIUS-1]QHX36014.1 cytidylate kinase [Spiroplasma sp. TIUS-1]
MSKLIIAVDGTAGSGKSSTMEDVAEALDYLLIDSGQMYRAFTKFCILKNINFESKKEIIECISEFNPTYKNGLIHVNGLDFSKMIFEIDITKKINFLTPVSEVREFITNKLREVGTQGTIMIGRDIQTVVLPNADLKLFFDTDYKIRAQRRYAQNTKFNVADNNLEDIEEQILARDKADTKRKVGPLLAAKDAIRIDTSLLSKVDTTNKIIELIKQREIEKGI